MPDNRTYSQSQGNSPNPSTTPVDHFRDPFFINGKLNPAWVSVKAQAVSRDITTGKFAMGATAMRNFYNEFLRIRALPPSKADEKLILVKLLKAKTNYKSKVQAGSSINNLFAKFINNLIDSVGDDLARFDQACYVFEAIIGYADKK